MAYNRPNEVPVTRHLHHTLSSITKYIAPLIHTTPTHHHRSSTPTSTEPIISARLVKRKKEIMPTWFITGCSSGFGLEIAKAAIAVGDKLVATSRDANKLGELEKAGALVLSLKIATGDDEVKKAVTKAIDAFGSIDILINNAGYVLEGAVEEVR